MCIIAVKPEKVFFSKAEITTMWNQNPDGAGFMYAENGKVIISKGILSLTELWDKIQSVGPLRKIVFHFRIRTHGAISNEMTHPFWVREGKLALVHNGVIRNVVSETSEEESDTFIFARKLSKNYVDPIDAIKSSFHRDLLEAYIGSSKIVFMDGEGKTYILNQGLGEWYKNVWYSNNKYKKREHVETDKKIDYIAKYKDIANAPEFDPTMHSFNRDFKKDTSAHENKQKPLLGLQNHWDRIPDNSHKRKH